MRNKRPAYSSLSSSLDPEYAKFRASTGHLTDFAPDRLSLYKAAVAKFADPTTTIGEGRKKKAPSHFILGSLT